MPFRGDNNGTFWTQSPNRDPKRGFRFKVEFGSSGVLWYAKKSDKPTLSFTEATHNIGYIIPAGTADGNFTTPSKSKSVKEFGGGTAEDADDIRIIQIDEDGAELEKWTLKHAWIKEVTFGDLDYGSDELTEVVIKFRYDWAQFDSPARAGSTAVRGFSVQGS